VAEVKLECFIYFIQSGFGDGPIKIGIAANPEARLKELQTANPYWLSLLGVIRVTSAGEARDIERELHMQFSMSRTRPRGEWFRPSLELFRTIETRCRPDAFLPGSADEMAAEAGVS
jgi:hypothetical protein